MNRASTEPGSSIEVTWKILLGCPSGSVHGGELLLELEELLELGELLLEDEELLELGELLLELDGLLLELDGLLLGLEKELEDRLL